MKVVKSPQKFRSQNSEKKCQIFRIRTVCETDLGSTHLQVCGCVTLGQTDWSLMKGIQLHTELWVLVIRAPNILLPATASEFLEEKNTWSSLTPTGLHPKTTSVQQQQQQKLQSISSIYWIKLPRHNTQKFLLSSLGSYPRGMNFPTDNFLGPYCNFHVLPLSCSRSKLLPNSR